MKHFAGSFIVTIIGFILAYLWGEHVHSGSGFLCIFIAFILSILEVSLSFDNAVVNAMKLEKMSHIWQHRFLTWGIAIAVFGMRFIFPILVVAIFAKMGFLDVTRIALLNADAYAKQLHACYPPIVAFGGSFLMMLFLSYFFNHEKTTHWIKFAEEKMQAFGHFKGMEILLTLFFIFCVQNFIPLETRLDVVIAGMWGVVIYLLIDGVTTFLDKKNAKNVANVVKTGGFLSFLYLELIDASFSLDGVLGAFALSKDILIITIGLSIGAMFVRSLTIMLVEKKTLAKYIYLEHGAHWAIGVLAIIMLVSTFHEIPEIITGLLGLIFILTAFASSLIHNKKI